MDNIFTGTGAPVSSEGFTAVSKSLGVEANPAPLWSILAVETRGFGYLPDRRQKILFERHIFRKRTGGRFDAVAPDLSNPVKGGYGGGALEYDRIIRAFALDRIAALESASWGLGQVMGFNASSIGYPGVEAMIADFNTGEDAQLRGCARFISATAALRRAFEAQDWARVAFFYNGSDYAARGYDTKLENAHQQFSQSLPDVLVRANQARLAYLGFNPRGIDGVMGESTEFALRAFQQSRKLKPTGEFDVESTNMLLDAAGV